MKIVIDVPDTQIHDILLEFIEYYNLPFHNHWNEDEKTVIKDFYEWREREIQNDKRRSKNQVD